MHDTYTANLILYVAYWASSPSSPDEYELDSIQPYGSSLPSALNFLPPIPGIETDLSGSVIADATELNSFAIGLSPYAVNEFDQTAIDSHQSNGDDSSQEEPPEEQLFPKPVQLERVVVETAAFCGGKYAAGFAAIAAVRTLFDDSENKQEFFLPLEDFERVTEALIAEAVDSTYQKPYQQEIEKAIGYEYLRRLISEADHAAANVRQGKPQYHYEVFSEAIRREMVGKLGHEAQQAASSLNSKKAEFVTAHIKVLESLSGGALSIGFNQLFRIYDNAHTLAVAGETDPVRTGFEVFDKLLGGYLKPGVHLVCGGSNTAKTATVIQLVASTMMTMSEAGVEGKILYCDCGETPPDDFASLILANYRAFQMTREYGVEPELFKQHSPNFPYTPYSVVNYRYSVSPEGVVPRLVPDEELYRLSREVAELPFGISYYGSAAGQNFSISGCISAARQMKANNGPPLKMLVLDYFQGAVTASTTTAVDFSYGNRCFHELVQLALDLSIPIIVIAQGTMTKIKEATQPVWLKETVVKNFPQVFYPAESVWGIVTPRTEVRTLVSGSYTALAAVKSRNPATLVAPHDRSYAVFPYSAVNSSMHRTGRIYSTHEFHAPN
jgi:replicative DNA helicase